MSEELLVDGFRLSPQQKYLWLRQQDDAQSPYWVHGAVLIEGNLNSSILEPAMQACLQRHEILRTSFHHLPGLDIPVQVIDEEPTFSLSQGESTAVPQVAAQEYFAQIQEKPPNDPSLFQAHLISLSPMRFVLCLRLHALCGDVASLQNLVQELAQRLEHYPQTDPLAEEPLQYADMAEWHIELLESEETEIGRSYWQNLGLPALPPLRLPFVSHTAPGFAPALFAVPMPTKVAKLVNEFAEKHEIAISTLLLACWQIVLWRMTGQSDVIVATGFDGRAYAELEDAVGLFARYLPIHQQFRPQDTLSTTTKKVEAATIEARKWQDSFAWELLLEPDNWHTLPHIAFDYWEQSSPITGPDFTFTMIEQSAHHEPFALRLVCQRLSTGWQLQFHYNRHLFTPTQISHLAERYTTLLAGIDRPWPISQLPILGEAERQTILADFSQTETAAHTRYPIHQHIEQRAAANPQHTAVFYQDQQLTYASLNRRANQLAHLLQARHVTLETPVALCLERSPEMIISILAVLKAGGAYVPIAPDYPLERITFMLKDSGAKLLLTQSHLTTGQSPLAGIEAVLPTIALGTDWPDIDALPVTNLSHEHPLTSLAYIIYTSGSTGQPKGVGVSHHNLAHSTAVRGLAYQAPPVRYLLLSSYAFDSSVAGIFWTLSQGGSLILPTEGSETELPYLAGLIRQRKVTHTLSLPSLYTLLLEETAASPLHSLQAVIVAGEVCPPQLVARHRSLLPNTALFNEYGPTEGTVWSTVYNGKQYRDEASVAIGRPIPNCRVYIVDSFNQPVPIGVAGELCLGGDGVSRGYHQRPLETAAAFRPNPFLTLPETATENDPPTQLTRLYHTGDLARFHPNGDIEYLGRIDHQVKIHGYRVELGEIEAILSQHPAVGENVVLGLGDSPANLQLVAYVVLPENQSAEEADLHQFLQQKLPDYMIPAFFVFLEAMPRTPNGKVDRAALPTLEEIRSSRQQPFVAPQTPIEKTLAQIWSDVLKLDQVGIHDNFFNLGGDSIRTIQTRTKAIEKGLDFVAQDVFQFPTIHQLAQMLTGQAPTEGEAAAYTPFSLLSIPDREKIDVTLVEDAYPLTRLQAGMLFYSELNPGTGMYHDIVSMHLEGEIDLEKMRQALDLASQRHPILRTSFDLDHFSQPVQLVHTWATIPLTEESLTELAPAEQEQAVATWISAEKQRPFNWKQAPLLRLHIHWRGPRSLQFNISFHHAILDGWSAATLFTELFQTVVNLEQPGTFPTLPPPQTHYAEFVVLEQQALAEPEQSQFWQQQLRNHRVTALPRWPASYRSSKRDIKSLESTLPDGISERLKSLAQSLSVPLKSVLLAAHMRVMRLLNGHPDVLIGLVSHGRPETADGERMLGLFLNTLPFRLELAGGTWKSLIQATFEAEKALLPYRHYPIAEIQRQQGNIQLFEGLFNFLHYHVYQSIASFQEQQIHNRGGQLYEETNFPFITYTALHPTTGNIQLRLAYDTSEFADEQVQAIHAYYLNAFQVMAHAPDTLYPAGSLLTEAERQQLLIAWNQTQPSPTRQPEQQHMPQLFEAQVVRSPQAIAASCGKNSLTYEQLNRRANRLAHLLVDQGVGPDVVVAILADRSLDFLAAILAVFKAGGAYLPLEPVYPDQRLHQILHQSQTRHLLVTHHYTDRAASVLDSLPAPDRPSLIDLEAALHRPSPESNLPLRHQPGDLAYVIYTSGSTGRPKGAMVENKGMLNHLYAKIADLDLTSQDIVAQTASQCFDISVWQFLAPLLVGGRARIIQDEIAHEPQRLLEEVTESGVTILETVPSLLHFVLQVVREGGKNDRYLNALRWLIPTGEALPPATARDWLSLFPQVPLLNAYGPTECSDDVTHYACSTPPASTVINMPIGRPVLNMELYVFDSHLQPVPIGVPAELYVGGVGVGRGYLHEPGKTAVSFIPHPYANRPGARLYKTGDLVRYLPDGNLEFLGRLDYQVKIHGHRIELEEIEAVLRQHPLVQAAVVVGHDVADNEKRLIAYLTSQGETTPTAAELRHHIGQQLPAYMVPALFIPLASMPRLPSGKINRRALPVPDSQTLAESKQETVAPRSPIEEMITQVWRDMLDVPSVGIQDNFFELGGHSLIATQVISRLRRLLQVELPLRTLFEYPTVAALAAQITELRQVGEGLHVPPLKPQPRDGLLPLSFAQERLWFLAQLSPDSAFYSLPATIRLQGPLDSTVLEESLHKIIERHELMRALFVAVDGKSMQRILPEFAPELPVIDLSDYPAKAQEAYIEQFRQREAKRPFRLDQSPPIRFTLLRLNEQTHYFFFNMHHIISDAWSLGILLQEIAQIYGATIEKRQPQLPELPIQYPDYAIWQRQWLSGDTLTEMLAFWQQQLDGAPPLLKLPTDHPRPESQTYRGASESLQLSASLSHKLDQLSHEEEATPFMTLLAAFQTLLYRYSLQDDVLVGTPIANRNHIETESLIGFFANTLVIRTKLGGNPTFRQLLQQVRENTVAAYAYQDLPFEKIVEALRPERSLSYNPIFQVMFALQNAPLPTVELPGLQLDLLPQNEENALFDLLLNAIHTGEGLRLALAYNADLFEAETIQQMLAHFQLLLENIVVQPDQPVESLVSVLPPQKLSIAITSTFTAEPLSEALYFGLDNFGIPAHVQYAPYAQVFQQLLDPSSLLATNREGINVFLVRLEDWAVNGEDEQWRQNVSDFLETFADFQQRLALPTLLCLCPPSEQIQGDPQKAQSLHALESEVMNAAKAWDHVWLLTHQGITSHYQINQVNDPQADDLGHIPYTPTFFAALGTAVSRQIHLLLGGTTYQAILIDANQTLWQGYCSEDEPGEVEVLASHHSLQEFLLQKRALGKQLHLSIRGLESDLIEVFNRQPQMPLKMAHLTTWQVGANPVSDHLLAVADTNRLPLEAIVFMSAEPAACALVRAYHPEVTTVQLPSQSEDVPSFLQHLWILDA